MAIQRGRGLPKNYSAFEKEVKEVNEANEVKEVKEMKEAKEPTGLDTANVKTWP